MEIKTGVNLLEMVKANKCGFKYLKLGAGVWEVYTLAGAFLGVLFLGE